MTLSCPISGKFLASDARKWFKLSPMANADGLDDLLAHLSRMTRGDGAEVERVVRETLDYFTETVEQFVARRHAELQAEDLRNDAIWERISGELRARRFAAPPLSARQIRRLVYG